MVRAPPWAHASPSVRQCAFLAHAPAPIRGPEHETLQHARFQSDGPWALHGERPARVIPEASRSVPVRRLVGGFRSELSQRAIQSGATAPSREQRCARDLLRGPEPCDALLSSDASLRCEAQLNAPAQPHARGPHDERSSLRETEPSAIRERESKGFHATLLRHGSLLLRAPLHETPLPVRVRWHDWLTAHALPGLWSRQRVESPCAPKRQWRLLCGPAAWPQPGLVDAHCWLSHTTLGLRALRPHAAADSS